VSDDLTGDSTSCASVAPGDTCVLNVTYVVTQADVDAGEITNTGTADSDQTPEIDDPEVVDVPQNPSINIVKDGVLDLGADGIAKPGDVIDYSFTVTNDGNVTLSNVTVEDPLLDSITCSGSIVAAASINDSSSQFVSSQFVATTSLFIPMMFMDGTTPATVGPGPNAAVDVELFAAAVSNVIASLAPGDSASCSGSYAITQADIDGGERDNLATTEGTPPIGDPVTDDDPELVDIPQVPSIDLTKSASEINTTVAGPADRADAGDEVTYSFDIVNDGNVTLSNAELLDALVGFDPAIACDGITTLAPDASASCSATYALTQNDIDSGSVSNSAEACADAPDGSEVCDPGETTTPIPQEPEIDLTKGASAIDTTVAGPADRADAGDQITYSFEIVNVGNVTLSNVNLLDALVGFDPPVTCDGATTLAPNSMTTCSATYTLTQADIDSGSVSNDAEACADAPDGSEVCDPDGTTTPIPQEPEISIIKTFAEDSVIAGGAGSSFALVVVNEGNVTLTDALIEDTVDSSLVVTGVSGTAGADADSDGDAQTVEWLVSTLAPGASATVTVEFSVASSVAAGTVPNTAVVEADAPDSCVNSATVDCTPGDEDTDTVDIFTDINLSIVKTFDPTEAPQGTAQSFTLEVSNSGPSDAVDVAVSDVVDGSIAVTGVSVTSGNGDCSASSGQTVDCTVQIPVGETVTITVDYVTAPFFNGNSPYGTQSGDDFRFVFVNGSVLEGSTDGGPVYLDGVDITNDVTLVNGLTKNEIVIDPDGPGGDPAFTLHLSCSDPFTGGWGQSAGPTEGMDTNWQIAFFSVARYQNGDFRKSCGNVTNAYDVPNTADATGTDSFGTETVSDSATLTVEPGIRLDRIQTNGKRVTVRLTNFTGEDKEIASVEAIWPSGNGNLKKVSLSGTTVWSGSEAPTSIVLDSSVSGWNGATLATGDGILRFDFTNRSQNSGYTIRVNFTDGTFLDIML